MVDSGRQRVARSTFTPTQTRSANFYRRIKRRLGRSLRRTYCKGHLVGTRKQVAYQLPRAKSRLLGTQGIPRPCFGQHRIDCNRQHYCGILHKQGRRHEVRPSLCSTLENCDLVYRQTGNTESPTHTRPAKCGSRQAIKTRTDNPDGMVPSPRGFHSDMREMAQAPNRPVCHEVQQQATSLCLSGPGSLSDSGGCTQPVLGGSGRIRFPTNGHLGQSGGEITEFPMQKDDSHCPGVAQHTLVLGSSNNVHPDPTEPAQHNKPIDSTIQSDHTQKPNKPEPPCMAPRASAIKEQGFSDAVAARIEAPQRGSTRSVYEAKWAIFTKWCISNQVDFKSPPVKSVADFLMHLFEDKKLQPSTIDGYRSAISDKLGNSTLNIGKDENLTRLLDSFHRDRPKGRRGIPSWNLSLVLHQLTKSPFEPLKDASLKHLTFKTVFLLALGSGKCRSEIHAWQNRNIRHQSDWSKGSLYPAPSFLSKNQLAKEGP